MSVETRRWWLHLSKSWRSEPSRRRGRDSFWQLVKKSQWEEHWTGSATLAVQQGSVPRRLFFAAQQRKVITLSPNYYQKMQHFTTRKNQEEHGPDVMYSKFGEIIKNYCRWENEPNQTSCKRPPPPPAKSNGECFWRVFHVVIQDPPNSPAVATRHSGQPLLGERAGWSAVWYNSLTGWWFSAKFKLKTDIEVLLFPYLNKIWLILTGEPGRVLAYLYSEAKWRGSERRLFLSRPHHVLQATSLCKKKSQPQQHTLNSKGFVLSLSNLLLHYSLHFQHLMKTKGSEFQDAYSNEEAFISIVHINS